MLVGKNYTWSDRFEGFVDDDYEALNKLNFTPGHTHKRKKIVKYRSRIYSPPERAPATTSL